MDQFWVYFQVIFWYFINIIRDIYEHNLVMFGNEMVFWYMYVYTNVFLDYFVERVDYVGNYTTSSDEISSIK